MKKQINKKFLSEGYGSILRDLANEKEDYVNEHPDYFMYETDDLEEFDTLEDAIAYAKKCAECNTITRVQIGYEEEGPEYYDEIVWEKENENLKEQMLNEGTSNFGWVDPLPLLVFYTYDEVLYSMDNDDENPRNHPDDYASDEELEDAFEEWEQEYFDKVDVCILDEYDVDELEKDLGDLNGELKSLSYELYDKASDLEYDEGGYEAHKEEVDHLYDQSTTLEDVASFGIEPGYYSAAYINCDGNRYIEDLDDEYKNLVFNKINEIKKKYGLTELEVAWGPASNGETGYRKVNESKKKSLKEGASYRGLAYYEYPKGSGCHVRETPEVFVAISESGKTLGQDKMKTGAETIIDEYLKKKNESIEGTPKKGDYKKLAKKHQKTNKKGARGTFERVANTDPKRNMEIFNHMMGSDVPASGEASVGVSEAKKPLSNREIDAKVKRNQKYLNHINKEKEQKSKGEKPIKEDIDEYDSDFEYCAEDVADELDSGWWHGQTRSGRNWGLIVNGGDGNQFSPYFADAVAYECSYPVRDGYFDFSGLDCVPNKSTFAYMDWEDEDKKETLKRDLLSVGCDEKEIEKFFNDEIEEIEFYIDYEIDIDDLDIDDLEEDDFDESLKEDKDLVKSAYESGNMFDVYDAFEKIDKVKAKKVSNRAIKNSTVAKEIGINSLDDLWEAFEIDGGNEDVDEVLLEVIHALDVAFKTSLYKNSNESLDEDGEKLNVPLAKKFGKMLMPQPKKKRPRYVYEVYWYDNEEWNGDPIFKKFWSNKERQQWMSEHENDPDKFGMWELEPYNMNESLKESRDEERVADYQKDLDELGATEEECNKFIKIADDYEEKAQRHFITYGQMDEVAKAMGLKEMSDKELARTWKVCYYTLNREAFKEDDSEDLKRYAKYSDAASAFAEVINREARERKEKGNYKPKEGEPLNLGEIIGDDFMVDSEGLLYLSKNTMANIVARAKDIGMSFEDLMKQKFEATDEKGNWGSLRLDAYENTFKNLWGVKEGLNKKRISSLKEYFTGKQLGELLELCKELGIEKMSEIEKIMKENNLKEDELLDFLRNKLRHYGSIKKGGKC